MRRFPLSLLLASILFAQKPAAGPPAAVAALAAKATAARDAEHIDEAIPLYRKVTVAAPKWAEGFWFLGLLSYQRQQFPACKAAFQRFTALEPGASQGVALLGLCEFGLKEYGLSLGHLEKAGAMGMTQGDPMTLMAQYHAAMLHTKAGNFERAIYHCTNMQRGNAESPELVVVLGLAALRRPIFPEELLPEDRDLVFRMGRAVLTTNARATDEASKQLEALLADYPKTPNIHYMYGSYLMTSDPDKGIAEMMKELDVDPDHIPALVSIVAEYLKQGDAGKALPLAQRAAKAAPWNFAARAIYGRALAETGDPKRGIEELEQAAKIAPDSPQVMFSLAGAYAKAGRKEDAARARAEFARLKKLTGTSSQEVP